MVEPLEENEAAAFPIRPGLRFAVALSLLLAVIGGVAFLGLLRMSALKVHKSVVLFAEPHPWPQTTSPAAAAVRSLASGRVSSPEGSAELRLADRGIPRSGSAPHNLFYELPTYAIGTTTPGFLQVSDPAIQSPPVAFELRPRAAVPSGQSVQRLAGLGHRIRTAAAVEDEVAVPVVSRADAACRDVVTVIPAGGVAQRFMRSELLVRLTDDVSTPREGLHVELLESRLGSTPRTVASTTTDALGLGEFGLILDAESLYSLRWNCAEQLVTSSISLPIVADGMALAWDPVPAGIERGFRVEASDLRSRPTWQVDLFCGGIWTRTDVVEPNSPSKAFETAPLPEAAYSERCLVQASTQPYLLHPQQAAVWVMPSTDAAMLRARLLALHDEMKTHASGPLARQLGGPSRQGLTVADEQTLRRATRWFLSWLPRSFEPRPLLVDSASRDLASLRAHKSLWRMRFLVTLCVAGAGLLLIWLPRAIAGLFTDRRALRQVGDGTDEFGPVGAPATRLWRSVAGLILVALLAVLVVVAMVWIVS